ncbi:MAG: ROK family transcriptional regulator [Planctomycetes bacterium]|nr:ROK family transcriptional regulator [Planctomycetota bacterium]
MAVSRVHPTDWTVLQVIQRLGAAPQHKLAEQMGRRRSTVNGAVQRLVASGWLKRVGRQGSGRGRPAILLAVDRSVGCFAGIDIAADELHCALVAADGTLLDHVSARLGPDSSLTAVLDQIDLNLRGVLSRVAFAVQNLLGLWAGINGAVDEQGVVVTCASLGWHNEPFREKLMGRYGCEVLVQGASAAMNAAAEALMGAGRDADSLVYYHAGRGISARFVRRGNPLSGATQRAGELGHVVVAPGRAKCACGNNGCLEAVASGPAIAAAIEKLPRRSLPDAVRKLLRDADGQATAKLVQASFKHRPRSRSDPLAALLEQVTNYLAMGAAMAVAAYDPEVLVLGGYLFEDNPSLRKRVQAGLRKMVLDWDKRNLSVLPGEVMTQDRAVGGAAEVCQRFWANPRGVLVTG